MSELIQTVATEALVASVAMSLYQHNVSPGVRAERLWEHFKGACAEPHELLQLVDCRFWPTEMAAPTARVYTEHALLEYAEEARSRVEINLGLVSVEP